MPHSCSRYSGVMPRAPGHSKPRRSHMTSRQAASHAPPSHDPSEAAFARHMKQCTLLWCRCTHKPMRNVRIRCSVCRVRYAAPASEISVRSATLVPATQSRQTLVSHVSCRVTQAFTGLLSPVLCTRHTHDVIRCTRTHLHTYDAYTAHVASYRYTYNDIRTHSTHSYMYARAVHVYVRTAYRYSNQAYKDLQP